MSLQPVYSAIKNNKFVILSLVSAVCISFTSYFYSAPRSNIGYGDSDEVITVAHLLGVAHPSGYPLVMVITKLFTLLPLGPNIAFRAHILAMVTHSLTVGLIALVGVSLASFLQTKKSKTILVFPAIASLLLTYSAIFWLYGGIIEVGALNNFFAALLIFATLKWQISVHANHGNGSLVYWIIMWAALGLGLSTVHTFLLLIPGVIISIVTTYWSRSFYQWKTNIALRRLLPGLITLFFSWLIPNLLLFWLNNHQASLSWVFDQNLNGWWRLIARRDYTGVILDQQREVSAYFDLKSLDYYLRGCYSYLKFLIDQLTWPVIALTILGFSASWKIIPRPILITIMSFFLVSGLMFGTYMGVPEYSGDNLEYRLGIGVSHRQYQLGHISFILLTVSGVVSLGLLLTKNKNNSRSISSLSLLGIVIILAILYQIQNNKYIGVQTHNTLLKDYARNMLDTAESKSVIICFSDISCYSLLYEQLVENYRSDVTVLIKNNYYRKYFLAQNPEYEGYPYGYNPFFASDLISWNAQERTTYLTEPDGFYTDYMGFDANPFYLIPRGYLYQVATQIPTAPITDDILNYSLSLNLSQSKISQKNYFQSGLKDYFAYKHMTLGFLYSKLGYKVPARYHQEMAIKLNSVVSQPRKLLDQIDEYKGDPRYAPGSVSPSAQEILKQYQTELKASEASQNSELLNQAYKTLMKAVFREPKSPIARLELAKLYQSGGYTKESRQELEYILKYNPEFKEASDLLNQFDKSNY